MAAESTKYSGPVLPVRQAGQVVAWTAVDLEDYDRFQERSWSLTNNGYVQGSFKGRHSYMHRVIAGLQPGDGLQVDHIDGDRLNNTRSNLRVVTRGQNMQNQLPRKHAKSSRFRGVCWSKPARKWYARIVVDGRAVFLGAFDDEIEAAVAADEGRRKYMTHARPDPVLEALTA